MSRIYFHSQHEDDAEVRGSERAYMGVLTTNIAMSVFDMKIEKYKDEQPLKRVVPPMHYLQSTPPQRFAETFRTWLQVGSGDDHYFQLGDKQLDAWQVVLNTAVAIGNDSLALLARIHAQCEIHCYVEGQDRAWLANIIDEGLGDSVYRRGCGWENASALLKRRADEPVVLSYSVCEQFPNSGVSTWINRPDDPDRDGWYDLSEEDRWRHSMDALRKSHGKLRIHPADWNGYGYGEGLSAFDVVRYLSDSHER